MQVGGSAQAAPSGYSDPNCQQPNIIVICTAAGQYSALSSSCTHACCLVTVRNGQLHCPCHGATFDFTGKSTSFVTSQPLPSLKTCSDANGVYVTI